MPVATRSSNGHHEVHEGREGRRLVLCFDGTGNEFQGSPGDTNIVKIYNMFDRGALNQMHYYQPGIGTYPAEGPVNVGFFRGIMRKFESIIDQALATSFDSHVIAGYRFIVRYYRPGDKIYMFGFSRGAFTARFLARMVSHIGLLSEGNEELIPFAFKVYQKYEQNRGSDTERQTHTNYMNAFKKHFCRTERKRAHDNHIEISENESGIKVHFLGLFDCVSSVGTLDVPLIAKPPPLPAVRGTAVHVRHAVAIDERRVKFKAALFAQEQTEVPEDIKEVWFPGNHGDVGGGWNDPTKEEKTKTKGTPKVDNDYFQLSDIALKWMVDELDDVEKENDADGHVKLQWDVDEKASFLKRFNENKEDMIKAKMHDTMARSGGSHTNSYLKIMLWHFLEYFPFIRRWELVHAPRAQGGYKWSYDRWPLNKGNRRDIPSTALFHHSVIERMRLVMEDGKNYLPTNDLWVIKKGTKRKHQSGTGRSLHRAEKVPRGLSTLAKEYQSEASNGHATSVPGALSFVHDEDLTKGSTMPDDADTLIDIAPSIIKPSKWDRIYHVVKN